MSRPYERGDQSQRTARYNGAQCGAAESCGAEERYLYTRERYNTRLLGLYPQGRLRHINDGANAP